MWTKQEWIGSIIIGLISLYFAKKKRQNLLIWFTIGFTCKLVGLCFLLLFPSILSFFKTRKPTEDVQLKKPPLPRFPLQTIWYYLDETQEQKGPISFQKLQEIALQGTINLDTYVWNEQFTEWKQWKELL